jgi:predicted transcriptional regulator
MTHTYAAKRLLEHGPLRLNEFVEITGWKKKSCQSALRRLVMYGIAEKSNRCYRLTEAV